jgi:signal transduction histidine kinase
VAHELRTPLASIALQAQALKSGQTDTAAMQAALQRIGRDALHAGHVLDQLLTLARAGRGMLDAPLQTVNWADVVRNVAAAQAQHAWQREDMISVDAPQELPVRGNALLLDSALRNLVENAVRHTPTGTQIEVQAGLDSSGRWPGCRSAMMAGVMPHRTMCRPWTACIWAMKSSAASCRPMAGASWWPRHRKASPPAIAWKYR